MHGRRERERGRDSLKRFLYFFEACIRALALNVPINDHPVFFFLSRISVEIFLSRDKYFNRLSKGGRRRGM